MDKALSKPADNQATLLSMSAGKPQGPPAIGMKSINITTSTPSLEETYKELMNYTDLLGPFLSQLNIQVEEEPLQNDENKATMLNIEKEPTNDKQVEEVKMLSETKEPLLDLDKCSLHELINILQKFANDPTFNVHQAGFGSYIANYVIKEKIERYNNEAMIPPKLGDAWLPKILITIGKETHHAILDLGSSVSVLSKDLYDLLDLKPMEKCSIDLLLADDSTKHALGKIKDIMVELHMTFMPVDFIVMDMGSNTSSPIILGSPFLKTTGVVIDAKEGNVKFQFPHKKCMEHFPRKKEVAKKHKLPHEFHIT